MAAGPFLYRYEPGGDDGFDGVEGAFQPTSWWAVSALAAVGRVDQARARADELCRVLPRLMPEEVDPATLSGLGNVPLVWSHAEAARSFYLLDAAVRRRRHGAATEPPACGPGASLATSSSGGAHDAREADSSAPHW